MGRVTNKETGPRGEGASLFPRGGSLTVET